MGVLRVRFSEEEKEEVKQTILECIDNEMSDTQIANSLRTNCNYCYELYKIINRRTEELLENILIVKGKQKQKEKEI